MDALGRWETCINGGGSISAMSRDQADQADHRVGRLVEYTEKYS